MTHRSGKEKGPARQAAQALLNHGETLGGSRPAEGGLTFTVKKGDQVVAYIHVDVNNKAERRLPAHMPGTAHNKGKPNPPKKK